MKRKVQIKETHLGKEKHLQLIFLTEVTGDSWLILPSGHNKQGNNWINAFLYLDFTAVILNFDCTSFGRVFMMSTWIPKPFTIKIFDQLQCHESAMMTENNWNFENFYILINKSHIVISHSFFNVSSLPIQYHVIC